MVRQYCLFFTDSKMVLPMAEVHAATPGVLVAALDVGVVEVAGAAALANKPRAQKKS